MTYASDVEPQALKILVLGWRDSEHERCPVHHSASCSLICRESIYHMDAPVGKGVKIKETDDTPEERYMSVVAVSIIPAVRGRIGVSLTLEPYVIDWSMPTYWFAGAVDVIGLPTRHLSITNTNCRNRTEESNLLPWQGPIEGGG